MDLNLKDKVVVVTGATSGIGEAIAMAFANEQAHVVVVGRNENRGQEAVAAIEAKGSAAIFIKADLTSESACKNVIDRSLERFGKIDILVNNAGHNDSKSLDSSPEDFMFSLRKNVFHYFTLLHHAKASIIENKGNIVNIGSKVANTGQGGTSGYAASKGAIQALTREWAVDFLPHGVRVNEVIPAEAWTPQYEQWINSFDNPQEKLASITKNIPLGKRMTSSAELADMVLFLASDRASHITGQHIFVDGGYTHLDRSIS